MELEQQVENLIEQIRQMMPSSGTWPFTVIRLYREEIKDLSFSSLANAKQQLLFLLRTDFDEKDFIDYIFNTSEFALVPAYKQEDFLNHYMKITKNETTFLHWSEKVTNMGVGMAVKLSESLNLCIEHIEANLTELDTQFEFNRRNLKAFLIFDVYAC